MSGIKDSSAVQSPTTNAVGLCNKCRLRSAAARCLGPFNRDRDPRFPQKIHGSVAWFVPDGTEEVAYHLVEFGVDGEDSLAKAEVVNEGTGDKFPWASFDHHDFAVWFGQGDPLAAGLFGREFEMLFEKAFVGGECASAVEDCVHCFSFFCGLRHNPPTRTGMIYTTPFLFLIYTIKRTLSRRSLIYFDILCKLGSACFFDMAFQVFLGSVGFFMRVEDVEWIKYLFYLFEKVKYFWSIHLFQEWSTN